MKHGANFLDESRILSWSSDKTIRLWDVATGRQIGPAMTHEDWVFGALLSRDESRILSWSEDKTVRLWDVSWRGRNLLEMLGGAAAAWPIAARAQQPIGRTGKMPRLGILMPGTAAHSHVDRARLHP